MCLQAKEFLNILNSAPNAVKMLVANFLKGNRGFFNYSYSNASSISPVELPPAANGNPIFQVKLTENYIKRQVDPNLPAITVAVEEWVQMDYSTGQLKRYKVPRKIA